MKEKEIRSLLDNIKGVNLFYGNAPFTLDSYKIDNTLERVYLTNLDNPNKTYDRPFGGLEQFINELKPAPESNGKPLVPIESNSDLISQKDMTPPATFKDLRSILLDNIGKLQSGKMEISQAKEIANQAQTIINITKMEIEFHKNFKKAKYV